MKEDSDVYRTGNDDDDRIVALMVSQTIKANQTIALYVSRKIITSGVLERGEQMRELMSAISLFGLEQWPTIKTLPLGLCEYDYETGVSDFTKTVVATIIEAMIEAQAPKAPVVIPMEVASILSYCIGNFISYSVASGAAIEIFKTRDSAHKRTNPADIDGGGVFDN